MKTEFINGEKEVIATSQDIYDSFNSLIFSEDLKVISKLFARCLLFNSVKDVPGDIVECGVFKGSGIMTWLKLKKALAPNSPKKVIGFDMFDSSALVGKLNGVDKERMENLFKSRNFEMTGDYRDTLMAIAANAGFSMGDIELIKGDASETTGVFSSTRPGAKISLLYMDMDIEKPTYDTLVNLWDNVTNGGIVVFDEYGYHQWSESRAVDRFIEERGLKINILNFNAPTAYIQK